MKNAIAERCWVVGSTVTLGSEQFTVRAAVIDADDFAPNSFVLAARRDSTLYRFFPHKGIDKGLVRIFPVYADPTPLARARKTFPTPRRGARLYERRTSRRSSLSVAG
ncbi:hypothetical protein A6V36_24290 [Paraburkholderia ginsengiterrae]|uniref:Uncharacterized protein n=1 Tax=Paraburkholderia ginsengiterrae TaxID=1462993 RepID=A0ABX2V1I4_9BURK|nr:hypothetical protein [Paraburkholderia ginsengiterrae]OAJ61495.1 hypothetical protein A6V36_24290 [Paraburkholderia ginsengiterrae]